VLQLKKVGKVEGLMNELSSRSIPLVDDEAVIRRILKRAISTLDRPLEVCEAEDGLEALNIVGERSFDVDDVLLSSGEG
jgi:CheY-like chemotaxis protein